MRLVVTDDLAKQKLLNSVNVEIAGKTGTAQEGEDRPAHALFISYAPYTAPEYSVTTVIPNGYSSGNAAELTAFVYAYLYDKEALTDATFANDTEDVGD
jgi:penicillin-binding protein 2